MEFQLLPIFILLSLVLVASHAALSPEAYWNSELPNTPMPKAVKDALYYGKGKPAAGTNLKVGNLDNIGTNSFNFYGYGATAEELRKFRNTDIFFLEKDMKQRTKMSLHFTKSTNAATFLPRQAAEKIPFSSTQLPEILNHFSLKPNSKEAEIMKKTIKTCENPGSKGEEISCATSLESMVEFITSRLGKSVRAISTEVEKETQLQKYSIVGVKKMESQETVVCHKLDYAYAVFYCHKIHDTKVFMVSVAGTDGTKAKAVAVCHTDTSAWNPKHLAFQMLKVKPGTVPICHFLNQESFIAWVPKH